MKKTILIGPIIFILFWSIVTYTGFVRPIFIPTPTAVLNEMFHLIISGEIIDDIVKTFIRLIGGFAVGAALGIPLGVLMGSSTKVYESLEFLVDFFRSIPVTCLFPLFMLVFGIGDIAKLFIAAWSSGLLILINTMYGVRHSSQTRRMVLKVMKGNRWQLLRDVILPDALPGIMIGFRTGISLALIVVIVSEMFLGTKEGLGRIIFDSSLLYETSKMYAAIFYAGAIGYGLNKLFVFIETRTVHWIGK